MSPELRSALLRGLMHAALVSAISFFTAWSDPSMSTRTLVSITVLPGLTALGVRFFGEGFRDATQAAKLGTPENAARTARAAGNGVKGGT